MHCYCSNGKVSTLVKPMRIVLSKKKRCKDFGIVVGGGRENGSGNFCVARSVTTQQLTMRLVGIYGNVF